MKTSLVRRAPSLGVLLSLLVTAAPLPGLMAQSDDFNDGDAMGWTIYDPLRSLGGPAAVVSFPGSNTFRIQGAARPAALIQAGQERVGALRPEATYSNFYARVDLVNWSNGLHQAIGILARITTPALQQTKGYTFTVQFGDSKISISRITGEVPTDLTGSSVTFTPIVGRQYRLEFMGRGSSFTGNIYELPNLTTPVATTSGTDTMYPSGIGGLVLADLTSTSSAVGGPVDATVDNYHATDIKPPTLAFYYEPSFNETSVLWPLDYSDWRLVFTGSLNPPVTWLDVPGPITMEATQFRYVESSVDGNHFFKLVRP